MTDIDVSDWETVEPAELLLRPSLVLRHPRLQAAARAVRYSRAGSEAAYDEIAFRLRAATPPPLIGPVPLETFGTSRLQRQRERRADEDEADRVRAEQVALRHRAVDFDGDGRVAFTIAGDLVHLTAADHDGTELVWTFALSHPPELLRFQAEASDAAPLAARRIRLDVPGMRWLPLPLLLRSGRFERMQAWAEQLDTDTRPGRYYAFVSHRWLTPGHPDPDGQQAQSVAWQLVAHLCEAVRIAGVRGLGEPRLQSITGFAIGPQGSDLAESLIVNLLRDALDRESLERARAEAATLSSHTGDGGTAAAATDPGLQLLRDLLSQRPVLTALVDRISLWYDYSCLPQPPRTEAETGLFRQGLDALNACQLLGITLVLLDDAEDYLQRAWCTLEGLVADSAGSIDTLTGSRRPAASGSQAAAFLRLMQDRPHIVWRGLLDTELFGLQDFRACLQRLSLTATDPADLAFIYDRLRGLGAPRKLHIDGSEIVTGTLPLPAAGDGRVLVAGTGRAVTDAEPVRLGSLDWTGALRLSGAAGGDRLPGPPARSWSARGEGAAHVAVVAACEGEAVLVAAWVAQHLPELESALQLDVASVSWTAVDIAPVGHLPEGALALRAVEPPTWVLVAQRLMLRRDPVASVLTRAVLSSGRRLLRLVLDEAVDNVEMVEPDAVQDTTSPEDALVAVDPGAIGTLVGGLHRSVLVDVLTDRRWPDARGR